MVQKPIPRENFNFLHHLIHLFSDIVEQLIIPNSPQHSYCRMPNKPKTPSDLLSSQLRKTALKMRKNIMGSNKTNPTPNQNLRPHLISHRIMYKQMSGGFLQPFTPKTILTLHEGNDFPFRQILFCWNPIPKLLPRQSHHLRRRVTPPHMIESPFPPPPPS
jgi:hypothetical protein